MISLAISSIWTGASPSKRSAAFIMISGWVLIPTVKVLGTLMRMFCKERAPCSGILIVIGVRLIYSCAWINGQTIAPPPCIQRLERPFSTLP